MIRYPARPHANDLLHILFYAALMLIATSISAVADSGRQPDRAGGLHFATGVPGVLAPAPVLSMEVEIDVNGLIARTRLRQTFENTNTQWAEAVYTFPLPEKSAVDRLRMIIGERLIEGEIQEKARARKTYETAKRAGRRTSLVVQERANIFSTEIANIPPGETITIEIEYQERLRFDNGKFSLRFPMVIRPRYNPGAEITSVAPTGTGWSYDTTEVADASRVTPPVAAGVADLVANPGAALNPTRLRVTLNPGFPLEDVWSPFHAIDVKRRKTSYEVTLSAGPTPADRDFVLTWAPAKGRLPTAGLFSETVEGSRYHLLMVTPPKAGEDPERLRAPRKMIIILDKSGSMAGDAIREAKSSVLAALDRLTPDDRFNIIAFASTPDPLYATAQPASAANIANARGFVSAINANGGTEMSAALALALTGDIETPGAQGYVRQIIFVTDGAVSNEDALFRQISTGLGASRLFTVGISSSPNSFFMAEAAEAGRGTYTYIGRADEVLEKMGGLFRKLESPLLTDIRLRWPKDSEADGGPVALYPSRVPDLYAGEPVHVTARTGAAVSGELVVTGRLNGAPFEQRIVLGTVENPGVAALWARSKITGIKRAARRPGGPTPEQEDAQILQVALAHGLVSEVTSLIAVDKVIARPQEELLVASAQPTNLAAGMDPNFAPGGLASNAARMRATPATAPKPPKKATVLRLRDASLDQAVAVPKGALGLRGRMMSGIGLLLLALGLAFVWRRTGADEEQ